MAIARGHEAIYDEHVRPLVRGLCGGFLFSVPILYTQEMWRLGYNTAIGDMLALLALTFALGVGLNVVSGFRRGAGLVEALADAVDALAIGVVVSSTMLVLLGQVHPASPWAVVVRQVVILAIPISIGASMARSLLGEQADQDGPAPPAGAGGEGTSSGSLHADAKDLALTAFGGIFLGLSLAPTEEIVIIATHSHWLQDVGMVALSLGLSYLTLFEARFVGQARRLRSEGVFQAPGRETVLTYAVSLVITAGLLWLLGFLEAPMAGRETLSMIVALALPVSLGGAAARLIL